MATKAQHHDQYASLPVFLRQLREEAELTQREIGEKLGKPQSWVYSSETGNRRVDVGEFARWAKVCGVKSLVAFGQYLERVDRK